MDRGTGKEKVIHTALSKLRDLTYPPQMQRNTRAHRKKKPQPPTSPIQRFTHNRLVCSLIPLHCSPVTGRIWTRVSSSISHMHQYHTHKKTNASHSVNTDTLHTHKKKFKQSYQGHRHKQPRQRYFVLNRCTKPHIHSHSCIQKLPSICSPTL